MCSIRRLDSTSADFDAALDALVAFDASQDPRIDAVAAGILDDVRTRGDVALLEYTARLDRLSVTSAAELELGADAFAAALARIPPEARAALEAAAVRIRRYHEHQLASSWQIEDADGTTLGQRVTPLDRVGLYVPGGKAAYPSSVLMNALPARVAGVNEIIMVVPTPTMCCRHRAPHAFLRRWASTISRSVAA